MSLKSYHLSEALLRPEVSMGRIRGDQRGSLKRQKTGWYGRWRQFEMTDDGKIVWQQVKRKLAAASATKAEALERLNEELSRANGPAACPQGMATLRQFVDVRFRPEHIEHLKPNGKRHYDYVLIRILEAFGDVRLRDLHRQMVQGWVNVLAKSVGAQTVKHHLYGLSAIIEHAKMLGFWRGESPTEYVRTPAVVAERATALSADQVALLLAHMKEPYRALVLLLASTGLRIGEALALDWSHVNIEDAPVKRADRWILPRTIEVRKNFSNGEWATVKSRNGVRDIPISDELAAALEPLRVIGQGWLLWPNRWGKPLDAHNLAARELKPACKAAAIPAIGWHDLRHTALTLMQQAGMSASEARLIAGHGSDRMTSHYTHGFLDRARGVMGGLKLGTEVVQ